MGERFERSFTVGWGDMDFNAHMANTSFLHLCGTVRMMFFSAHGYSIRRFEALRLGPVILRDEMEYFREMRLLDTVRVTLELAGLSDDGKRFRLRNAFFHDDGTPAARVTSTGGWLDLATRRLAPPPPEFGDLFARMVRSDDFAVVPPRGG
jgi:acyl-CoA thioester hydrolase